MNPLHPSPELWETKISIQFVPIAPKMFPIKHLLNGYPSDPCGLIVPGLIGIAAQMAKPATPIIGAPAAANVFTPLSNEGTMLSTENRPPEACGWTFTIRK
jgi:hypothetical protein